MGRKLKTTSVDEITVDETGRLLVRPRLGRGEDFAGIYRAAMGVSWDSNIRSLMAPVPREWTHFDWFRHMVAAVVQEYGIRLVIRDDTKWTVPDELRHQIQDWYRDSNRSA